VRPIALRPEAIVLDGEGGTRNRMEGTIEEVSFLGSVVRIRVRFGDNAVWLDTFNNPGIAPPARGSKAVVSFDREDLLLLEAGEAR
jgi:putative spermidine/putrescine transport system ATP-binding protein